jgi:hypothetical protein
LEVYLEQAVLQVDGLDLEESDFFSRSLPPDASVKRYKPYRHLMYAHALRPAIIRQIGNKGTVQITGYFVDGEGTHWLADSSIPFDLNRNYSGGPSIDFI